MSLTPKARRLVLTGAVTAITIAGSIYGAQIKMQQDVSQINQEKRDATIHQQIESLRTTRRSLTAKKDLVERQIRDLDARTESRRRKDSVSSDTEQSGSG